MGGCRLETAALAPIKPCPLCLMDWITDRQPTTEDEDTSGYVWMKRSPMNYGAATVSAAHVGPGVPWQHTEAWIPLATPATELDITQLDPIQPEPWPLPRVFAAPIRRTFLPSGGQVLDAIADDGTCWQMFPSDTGWQQIQPLPPATEETN